MKLNSFHLGSGPNLIIIHGLFGSASNFRTIAKNVSGHYTVYCIDLRNHGASLHDDDISFEAMASDLIEFMDDHGLKTSAVMGHSLGGKVAMQASLIFPDRISKLIIGDIAPVAYPHHHDRIFEGLNEVTRRVPTTRKEAEKILANYINIPAVRLFLLTNLVWSDDGTLVWRINVRGLQKNYADIAAALHKKPHGTPYTGPSLFIRGSLSDYIKPSYYPAIHALFPNSEITTIEGAGHWLHAEKPAEYTEIILNFLK